MALPLSGHLGMESERNETEYDGPREGDQNTFLISSSPVENLTSTVNLRVPEVQSGVALDGDVHQHCAPGTPIPQHQTPAHPHLVRVGPQRAGWTRMNNLLHQMDKDKITGMKGDMDTLLLFTGLFSVVVSAFLVESHKNLREQPEDITAQALLQISAQLASFTLNGNFLNSTIPPTRSFVPPLFSVHTNTLWTLSLITALITASIGIQVKQWLCEFLTQETYDPKEVVKVRLFRWVGITKWRVLEIATSLPLLLQLALALFFVGLALYLYEINTVVASVAIGAMSIWAVLYSISTIMPMFSPQCPYKTPILKTHLSRLRLIWRTLPYAVVTRLWPNIFNFWTSPQTLLARFAYSCRERMDRLDSFEEKVVSKDISLDIPAILCIEHMFQGEDLADTIAECFQNTNGLDLVSQFARFIDGRSRVARGVMPVMSPSMREDARELFSKIIASSPQFAADVGEDCNPITFSRWFEGLSKVLSASYIVGEYDNRPIPTSFVSAFGKFMEAGPTSAAFAILVMYGVRHSTITEHPDSYDDLFPYFSHNDQQKGGNGDRILYNILTSFGTLTRLLYFQPRTQSDHPVIVRAVAAIRSETQMHDSISSTDPISFVHVFAIIIHHFVPRRSIEEHRAQLLAMMEMMSVIITDVDGSSLTNSAKRCIEATCGYLRDHELDDSSLGPKLRLLGDTMGSSRCH